MYNNIYRHVYNNLSNYSRDDQKSTSICKRCCVCVIPDGVRFSFGWAKTPPRWSRRRPSPPVRSTCARTRAPGTPTPRSSSSNRGSNRWPSPAGSLPGIPSSGAWVWRRFRTCFHVACVRACLCFNSDIAFDLFWWFSNAKYLSLKWSNHMEIMLLGRKFLWGDGERVWRGGAIAC